MKMNHETTSPVLNTVLEAPLIRRTRRNHALEHATIHMLSYHAKKLSLVGRSDSRGIVLIGNVPTELVRQCAEEGLQRLRNGEHELAIHPNCGTNMVATAAIGAGATMAALLGSQPGRRGRRQRLPLIVAGILAAIAVGRPLGLMLQAHVTTLADPGDLHILEIRCTRIAGLMVHRIETASS
jgi:hypothetical protein